MHVDYTPSTLDRGARFYVAGHRGLVGSAIVRSLEANGFDNVVGKTSLELDLKNRDAVFDFFAAGQATICGAGRSQSWWHPCQ